MELFSNNIGALIMNSISRKMTIALILFTTALGLCITNAFGQYSSDWFARGSHPKDYEMGGDPTVSHGAGNSGFIKSKVSETEGFGTWMTKIEADKYLGERLRISAYVKTKGVEDWVGLWMRVDGAETTLSFDNMGNRPIKGTTDWEKYDIVLDVPESSTGIFYGILLNGKGQAWIDGLQLETVSNEVLVTDPNISNNYFKQDKLKKDEEKQSIEASISDDNIISTTIPGSNILWGSVSAQEPGWGFYAVPIEIKDESDLISISAYIYDHADHDETQATINFAVWEFKEHPLRELFISSKLQVLKDEVDNWKELKLNVPLHLSKGKYLFAVGQSEKQGFIAFGQSQASKDVFDEGWLRGSILGSVGLPDGEWISVTQLLKKMGVENTDSSKNVVNMLRIKLR